MDSLRIGFIGGCINRQIGMEQSDLYHAVLDRLLAQRQDLRAHHISLATYLSYDQMRERTERFIQKEQLDILFVFIRPFPLMPLQKLLIKYDKTDRETGWTLHPAIFDRNQVWPSILSAHQSDNGYRYVKRSRFEWRDLNILTGLFLGLHHWAMAYLHKQLEHVKLICAKGNIKLFIISPPQNPESILGDLICRRTTNSVACFCAEREIDFIDINSLGAAFFEKDKLHFSAEGHKMVAEIICDHLGREVMPLFQQRASVFPNKKTA